MSDYFKKYNTILDIKHQALQVIDVNQIVDKCEFKWFNESLVKVNNSVIRLGVVEGEYHWHKHDNEDEFFFVLDGKLFVDTEDQTFELNSNQGITVPAGYLHRTRAERRTVMLMVETVNIVPTGD